VLEIDGEIVVRLYPEIGYLHTGIEKTCEAKFYQQVVPLTDRIDYLARWPTISATAWPSRSCWGWRFRRRRSGCGCCWPS
jgi:NADH:ubiquinone oxidoreductase subunit D